MAGGATVDRRAPAAGVLGNMRRNGPRPQVDEAGGVVRLVGPQDDAMAAGPVLDPATPRAR